jgi:hypothetical protein
MNAITWPVLNVMVGFAQRRDPIMPLWRSAHPVSISNDMMNIDRPSAADKARQLGNPFMVPPVCR